MARQRIPIEIVKASGEHGAARMVPQVSLEEFVQNPGTDMQEEMEAVTQRYVATLNAARVLLAQIASDRQKTRSTNARLYWDLASLLQQFIDENERTKVFLNGVKGHFLRDLGISSASWKKILRFYHLVPSKDLIRDVKGWKFYRDAPTSAILASFEDSAILRRTWHGQQVSVRKPSSRKADSQPSQGSGASGIGPLGIQMPSVTRKRSRIEVHLSSNAMSRLEGLAGRLGVPPQKVAAVSRVLLEALLTEPQPSPKTLAEIIEGAKESIKTGAFKKAAGNDSVKRKDSRG